MTYMVIQFKSCSSCFHLLKFQFNNSITYNNKHMQHNLGNVYSSQKEVPINYIRLCIFILEIFMYTVMASSAVSGF